MELIFEDACIPILLFLPDVFSDPKINGLKFLHYYNTENKIRKLKTQPHYFTD